VRNSNPASVTAGSQEPTTELHETSPSSKP
jgi:hypothetical protein